MKTALLLALSIAGAFAEPLKIGDVTVQGSFRSRLEGWDWFEGQAGNSYAFSGNILRLSFSQSKTSLDWQFELAAPFLLGLPSTAIAAGVQGQMGLGANYYAANGNSRNSGMVFAKQAFLRFKNLGGSKANSLRIGRFEFADGAEMTPKSVTLAAIKQNRINMRLLGHFGWSDVGRSFDGLQYSYNKPNANLTFLGAVPTRGAFQTDGWGELNAAFGYTAYTRAWGSGGHAAETRGLALYYDDWRRIVKTDSRALAVRRGDLANIRIWTFGGHHISAFETTAGTVDLMLWGVGQTGRWGALDQRAHAISIEGGIQPKIGGRLKPWFRGGYFDGSGDGNPNDNVHGTFFQVLPTPRPFARFPFFNLMNNRDILGILTLRPRKDVTISSEFHAMRLSAAQDLWYLGGGAFQPWTFGYVGRAASGARSLANLYDASVDWRARENVTISAYFGHASGRAVISAIYPKGAGGNFGYLELLYRF
ncbi:MAG: alginate export family protein [Bryobacterales bacterium]|nr:alginate export family protein [Bryobacterales bacterium]